MTALGKYRILFTAAFFSLAITIIGIGRENPLFISLGIILFLASGIGACFFKDESDNISAWKRGNLGTAKTYPENKQEWENIQTSGWIERVLVNFAIEASCRFDRRKECKERCEEISKAAKKPKDLPPMRDTLKVAGENLKFSEKLAQKEMNRFLKTWDLFKKQGVLPKNPKTRETWASPDLFRKAVYENYKYFLYAFADELPPGHLHIHLCNYGSVLAGYERKLDIEDWRHFRSCEICLEKINNHLQINELLL